MYKPLSDIEVGPAGLPAKLQFRRKLDESGHVARGTRKEHQDSTTGKPGIVYPNTKTANSNPGKLKHRLRIQTESTSTLSSVTTVKVQATTERPSSKKYPSSIERLNLPSQQEKTHGHVYGEQGCPDNPWRNAGLTELLQKWINICEQYNIEYILYGGSLLGAMRNNDIIPYDSDIDVLIDINYFTTMRRLAERRRFLRSDGKIHLVLQPEFTMNIPVEKRKRYDCQGKVTSKLMDECSFQEPLGRLFKGNLHIDIYHFYDRVHFVDDPSDDKLKEYPKKDFYPFKPCNFMGFEASCPSNPWEISRIYFNTDDFLEPVYKCKNGTWVNKNGRTTR
ncbi:uncharacterized protein LOC111323350 [Stylophora pistillata]|uniref:Fukutin-related protein n=1 Tax=Stylophora pistillata TaxID=50429 RepID=A0A2B4SP55_STYPI|nr:uncharacterized protein LOC111323350 [Stylophora pistillata]PFX30660.1 Fukutin-related protein [Stylophora pistillata]